MPVIKLPLESSVREMLIAFGYVKILRQTGTTEALALDEARRRLPASVIIISERAVRASQDMHWEIVGKSKRFARSCITEQPWGLSITTEFQNGVPFSGVNLENFYLQSFQEIDQPFPGIFGIGSSKGRWRILLHRDAVIELEYLDPTAATLYTEHGLNYRLISAFVGLLSDSSSRVSAISVLETLDSSIRQLLIDTLRRQSKPMHLAISELISIVGEDKILEITALAFLDPLPSSHKVAVQQLVNLKAIQALVCLALRRPTTQVIHALKSFKPQATQYLAQALLTVSRGTGLEVQALKVVASYAVPDETEFIDFLGNAMKHRSPSVRKEALLALCELQADRVTALAERALEDDSPYVRLMAALYLRKADISKLNLYNMSIDRAAAFSEVTVLATPQLVDALTLPAISGSVLRDLRQRGWSPASPREQAILRSTQGLKPEDAPFAFEILQDSLLGNDESQRSIAKHELERIGWSPSNEMEAAAYYIAALQFSSLAANNESAEALSRWDLLNRMPWVGMGQDVIRHFRKIAGSWLAEPICSILFKVQDRKLDAGDTSEQFTAVEGLVNILESILRDDQLITSTELISYLGFADIGFYRSHNSDDDWDSGYHESFISCNRVREAAAIRLREIDVKGLKEGAGGNPSQLSLTIYTSKKDVA